MGWSESPPLFCMASKTAWDIAQEKLDAQKPLKPHPTQKLLLARQSPTPTNGTN